MVTVVVTDGEQRSALAVVRSLGAAGYRVVVTSGHPAPLTARSRYCARLVRTPDPLQAREAFVREVAAACSREGATWLIPVTEASLRAVLPDRGNIQATIPFPDEITFTSISDKALLLARAAELGLEVPRQEVIASADDIEAIAPPTFPVVIKPSRSVHAGQRFSVQFARDHAELDQILSALGPAAFPILVQERIVGPGTGIFLLLWDREVRAVFAHQRVREKPTSGGVSTASISVEAPPQLVEQSRLLLSAFQWQGVAMVEFKRDQARGRNVLMEVNGRFWGSLQLAIDAGVDFPRLLLEVAGGKGPSTIPQYRSGVRTRWWWGDLDHLLARMRHSTAVLHLPPDSPTRLAAARHFLLEPGRNEVLRLDDPRPALAEALNWFLRR